MGKYNTLNGGYLKKLEYSGKIEYLDVAKYGGLNYQTSITSTDSILSQMNFFTITTNTGIDTTKKYKSALYNGKQHTLESLSLNLGGLIDSSNSVGLNYDETDLTKLVYYGSMSEYARVSVQNTLNKWVASLFLKTNDYANQTAIDATYYSGFDQTIFYLNPDVLFNPFGINIYDVTSEIDETRNFILNWSKYVLSVYDEINDTYENNITTISNVVFETSIDSLSGLPVVNAIKITADGNPFLLEADITTGSTVSYHIRPNSSEYSKFKYSLKDFEKILLLNETEKDFTSIFSTKKTNDEGTIENKTIKIIWKRSDGYNIDYSGSYYQEFVTNLLELTQYYDSLKTDIIYRFLIAENLLSIDTLKGGDYQNSEEAVMRFAQMLRIFGRFLDETRKYIDGIGYVNTFTYDNKNNIGDGLVKVYASNCGWDVFDLFGDINIEEQKTNVSFWKELVINTPYIWGSKGTRKSVEFLLEYMGIPDGLIEFNEYIYRATDVVSYENTQAINELVNANLTTLPEIAIDENGYPLPLANNGTRWFQSFGGWYKETGGLNADYELRNGNNPHIGEYDDGSDYWLQFTELVPNFVKTIESNDVMTYKTEELFTFDYSTISRQMKKWSFDYNTKTQWASNENIIADTNDCGCLLPITDKVFKITFTDIDDVFTDLSIECECGVVYNNRVSGLFTKNNCEVGLSGTTVEYVVEANSYTGCTQEEANQQAYDDLLVNGQDYANDPITGGDCFGNTINFTYYPDGDESISLLLNTNGRKIRINYTSGEEIIETSGLTQVIITGLTGDTYDVTVYGDCSDLIQYSSGGTIQGYIDGVINVDSDILNLLSLCGTSLTNYESPYPGQNNVSELNFTDRTTNLEFLYLSNNDDLSNLDITNLINIKSLYINDCSELQTLIGTSTSIVEIHVQNSAMKTTYFANLPNLEIFRGNYAFDGSVGLDFSNCVSLVEIDVNNYFLTGLTITNCDKLLLVDVKYITDVTLLNLIFSNLPDYSSTPGITGYISHTLGNQSIYEVRGWVKIPGDLDFYIYGVFVEDFDYKIINNRVDNDTNTYLIATDDIKDINFSTIYNYGDVIQWNTDHWDIIN